MGLEIKVLKPIKPTEELIHTCLTDGDLMNYDYYSISQYDNLKAWLKFSFKKNVEYFDWEKTFSEKKLNFVDYEWIYSSFERYFFKRINDTNYNELTGEYDTQISFSSFEACVYTVEEDIIICECVGYQSKGANGLFYEENIWDSNPITTKIMLNEHWEKYFSKNVQSKGGFGYSVEYKLTDEEMKEKFKYNIINKFIENETFVVYC